MVDCFSNLDEVAAFRQEKPPEAYREGERVVVLGDDSFEIKKSGVTARSPYAIVVDFRDGSVTSILVIQDLSAIAAAHKTDR